ncbi:MAG: flagellar hook-associated protein FlgL [Pigmentiphaga sp.]|nr:flagellar hook-associated protein FlgL [Pigmentiphaga sp.]
MRLSTVVSHQLGVNAMTRQEGKVVETMQQLASGKRVLSPADDPLAASQAVNVAQTQSLNQRYGVNRDIARQSLSLQEQSLSTIATTLTEVSTRLVEAGGVYSDADRVSVANVLSEMRNTLLGFANTTDGNGQYLYSGDKGNIEPFAANAAGGVAYHGDAGSRDIQVAQTRQMSSAASGADVFLRAAPGSLVHFAEAGLDNQGTVTFGSVELRDPRGSAAGGVFQIRLENNPDHDPADPASAEWRVRVTDSTTGDSVPTLDGSPYRADGTTIDLGGVNITLSGEPVDGDSFVVASAAAVEMDMFTAIDNVVQALQRPTDNDPVAAAALSNALATAARKVTAHFDNVLTVRSAAGARLNELDALDHEGDSRNLNYRQQLSSLEDLDYRAASSDMAVRVMALQAAELAYMKTQGLGLFSRK